MPINKSINGISIFKNRSLSSTQLLGLGLGRAPILIPGAISDVDSDILKHLEKLNSILAKKSIKAADDLAVVLDRSLTPEQVPDTWEPNSLVDYFRLKEDAAKSTLTDYIDKKADLSKLKYEFQDKLAEIRDTLDFETRTVLSD